MRSSAAGTVLSIIAAVRRRVRKAARSAVSAAVRWRAWKAARGILGTASRTAIAVWRCTARTVASVSARSAVSAAARTALAAAIHNAHDGEVDAGGIKQIAAVFGLFVARGWNTTVELPLYACRAKRDGLFKHSRSSCVRALNASSASSGRSLCVSIQSRCPVRSRLHSASVSGAALLRQRPACFCFFSKKTFSGALP